MPDLTLIKRPVVLAAGTSAATLTDILDRIETIKGRATEWGVTDSLRASLLAGSSLEADFQNSYYREGFVEAASPTFLPSWTFTRTGAGTALTQGQTLTSFLTGVPRITDRGLMMEDAATKLLLHSQTIGDGVNWFTTGSPSASIDAARAPDGTMTASVLTLPASGDGYYAFGTTVSGQPYEASMFLRSDTPGTIALVSASSGAGSLVLNVTTEWQQFHAAFTAGSTSDGPWLKRNSGGQLASVEAWGAGLELGKVTSYVPTTAATVTRGADSAAMTLAGTPEFTLYAEVQMGLPNSLFLPLVYWDGGMAADRIGIYRYLDGVYLQRVAGGVALADVAHATGKSGVRVVRAAATYKDGLWSFDVDGVSIYSGATGALPQGLTTLRPGWSPDFDRRADGYVRKVLHIPYALTPAERLAITGG